jgi:hypothetical protein
VTALRDDSVNWSKTEYRKVTQTGIACLGFYFFKKTACIAKGKILCICVLKAVRSRKRMREAMIGSKLFKIKKSRPGELYTLYVLTDDPIPVGIWMNAEEGPKTNGGKVKSKIGPLAFRPGWHLSDIPLPGAARRRESPEGFSKMRSANYFLTI